MKKIFSLLALLITFLGTAQIVEPVKWSSSVVKVSDTELDLVITAVIENHWHLYSQFTPEGGALPLFITYNNQKGNYQLIGKTKESKYKKSFNETFAIDEYYFEHNAKFTQRIKILNPKLKTIEVLADGQACIDGKCVQTSGNLKFKLPELKVAETTTSETVVDTVSKTTDSVAETVIDTVKSEVAPVKDSVAKNPVNKEEKSLWSIFFLAFLGGFAALLMPCIFPMIPMTVSFFTKQSKTKAEGIKNAIIYGISIIVIYVLLGSLITGIFGPKALYELSSSVTFNLIFFVLLIVFALSFLGAFEIMLPSSWATKIDSQAGKGGMFGIFFMALALAVVSFSCTGPIVGTLLVESSRNGGLAPIVGMFGFSLAIALPFMLFAMFPGWLNSMPKSGGWLNTVKVSLGFLELAFAFKFLSNADLVLQKHWLERELFIAIWIAVFAAWALYLFGKYMLPHDYEKVDKIGVGRLVMAIIVTTFTFYMVPGLWGAPLKILSGLTPPMTYAESVSGFGNGVAAKTELPEHAHAGPQGIIAFEDYEHGLAYAKKVGKPVLLDFTGHTCANCRKMEDNVWSDPSILAILKEKVVLISLYCDSNVKLKEGDEYVSKSTGYKINTLGNKWTDLQISRYKSNSQPLYVIIDNDGNDLDGFEPMAFNTDLQEYKKWLEEGIVLASKK
jgi:thiol:disulfide interchange protein